MGYFFDISDSYDLTFEEIMNEAYKIAEDICVSVGEDPDNMGIKWVNFSKRKEDKIYSFITVNIKG